MLFSSIFGYNDVKTKLIQSVKDGRVAHALLFSGPDGSPIVPLALAFSQYLFCNDKGETDSCGVCHPCTIFGKLSHPDFFPIFPVSAVEEDKKKESSIGRLMPQWRKFITQQPFGGNFEWAEFYGAGNRQPVYTVEDTRALVQNLSLKSFEGTYKIAFLWLADQVRLESANALLKNLEEPTSNTIYILVSYQPERLLPTILSRVQGIRVRGASVSEVETYLTTHQMAKAEAAHEIALACQGNYAFAIDAASKGIGSSYHTRFANWMRKCFAGRYEELGPLAEDFASLGREGQKAYLSYGLSILRQVLMAQMGIEADSTKDTFVSKFSTTLSPDAIEPMAQQLDKLAAMVQRNIAPKLAFFATSTKLHGIMRAR